jgi:hypothetical protein
MRIGLATPYHALPARTLARNRSDCYMSSLGIAAASVITDASRSAKRRRTRTSYEGVACSRRQFCQRIDTSLLSNCCRGYFKEMAEDTGISYREGDKN